MTSTVRKMFWLTILAVIIFTSDCSAMTFTSYTISGCTVKLDWNLTNAYLYEIFITSQNNSSLHVQIATSEHTFVFVAERQGVYTLKWTPIYYMDNRRYRGSTSEDHTVYIAKGCNLDSTTSPNQDKDFYVTYFWVSAIVFPVVLGGTLLSLYLCLVRRPKGTVPENGGGEEARQSVSVNSLCYANNQQNPDCDESYYSLAR